MKNTILKYILTVLLTLTTLATSAQPDTITKSKYHFWLNTSIHTAFSDEFNFLIGAQLGLNFSIHQRHFFQLKAYACLSTSFIDFSGHYLLKEAPPYRLAGLTNLSFLYGLGEYKTVSYAVIPSIGLSYGKASYRGKLLYIANGGFAPNRHVFEWDNYTYIGLPINISFMSTKPAAGLSVDIYVNIHKHADYGLTLNLHFGNIRDKEKTTANIK